MVMVAALLFVSQGIVGDEEPEDKFSSGLVAHYWQDREYWDGNWPDPISRPMVDPVDWTFSTYKYSRVEPLINHLFIRQGWFTVRWVGYIDPSGCGRGTGGSTSDEDVYNFEIHADDGCRLIIDGNVLIDDWSARWELDPDSLRKAPPVRLKDGRHRIVIEYFQGQSLQKGDFDPMKLFWSCAGRRVPRQIVPASHFSHTPQDLTSTSR
jgi:hypothetical protein